MICTSAIIFKMIVLYLIGKECFKHKRESKSVYYQGSLFNVVSGELVVSSPDEITRERLEAEATLLDSVERETECEAITEREDTYEVIIDNGVQIESENFSIGMYLDEKKLISKNSQLSVSHIEDTSSFGISPHNDAPAYLNLRRYLNCLDQEDTRLIGDIREHYIRFDTFTLTLFFIAT